MKRTCLAMVLASVLLGASATASAQAMPPPLPSLTAEQSTRVQQEMDRYRRELDDRLARGNIMPDEAQRLRKRLESHLTAIKAQLPTLNPQYDPNRPAEPLQKKGGKSGKGKGDKKGKAAP